MRLIELRASNFMPYKGSMSVSFPEDPDKNVMLVFGENMKGKTSLLNTLRWVFYGKAVGRHSREIPLQDLMNKDATLEGDWTMEASITFEAEGHSYELRRRATKRERVARPGRPEDFEVVRALRRDGIPLSDHLIDAEINRFAPEQTSRFFLFDGELLGEYESLLVEGSEQGKKIKAAIEQALGVPTLIRGREDAQTLAKAAQKQQTKDIDKIAGLEVQTQRQASLQSQLETVERDLLGLRARLATTSAERQKQDEFIEATELIHTAKAQLVAREASLKENSARQEDLAGQRLSMIQDAWRELLRGQLMLKREHLHEAHDSLTQGLLRRSRVEGRIEQLQQSLTSAKCQSCGQDLHLAQREAAGAELGRLQGEITGIRVDTSAMQSLAASIRDLDRLLRPSSATQIASIDAQNARLSVEATKHENEIERLRDQIKGHDTHEIARRRSLRDSLLTEEGRLQRDIEGAEAALDKVRKELAMLSRALESSPRASGARSTKALKLANALERLFARSIERLREDLKSRVEQLASRAFKELTTQPSYSGLRINSNYGLTILDERGHEVPVRSAGAEQIVALSLIDGLAGAGRAAGPVVMDTPFGRLDPKHRANILRYLPTTTTQLVLMVHEGEVNRTSDLEQIGSRVGRVYEIKEEGPRHSTIGRVSQ